MEEVQATVTLLVLVVLLLMLLVATAVMVVNMVLSEAGIKISGAAMAVLAAMVVPMAVVVLVEREGVVELAAPVELVSLWLQPSLQVVREPSAFQVLRALQALPVPVQPVDWVARSILNTRLQGVLVEIATLEGEGAKV